MGLVDSLYTQYGGVLTKYKDLDANFRKAVDVYLIKEHENRVGINSDSVFACMMIPTAIIKHLIMASGEYNHYGNFENYHKDYMRGGDIVRHRNTWAIIIDNSCIDLILDGWHRFHWYCEKGLQFIPCISLVKA